MLAYWAYKYRLLPFLLWLLSTILAGFKGQGRGRSMLAMPELSVNLFHLL